MFKLLLLYSDTPGDVFSIRRLPHRQRSAAGQTRPRSGAASVDPHLSPASGIQCMMVYTAPHAEVDRVEVGAVGRPEVRRDERWCFTTQKLNRCTCPTNGDVSGPVSEYRGSSLNIYGNIYHKVTIAFKCRLIDDSLYQSLLILNQDCWSYLKM